MKITVLEKKKNKMQIELDADHTLCNILKKEMWNDKDTHVSGYYNEHIQVGNPRMMIETATKDPIDAMRDTVKRVKKINTTFLNAFADAK